MSKILLTTLLLFLNACTSPSLEHQDNQLEILMHNKSIVKGVGKQIYEKRVILSNINIYQKVYLMSNNRVLTYEDVKIGTKSIYNVKVEKQKLKKDKQLYIKSKWSPANIILDTIISKYSTLKVRK